MTNLLTQDDFLGGRLRIWQPSTGYRAGIDPVLLAAAVPGEPGQSCLELGLGVGTATLCLNARVSGLSSTGVELQTDYAELARRNAAENQIGLTVVTADLRQLPQFVKQQRFDHVLMNPPYFDRTSSTPSQDAGRDLAFAGATPLDDWFDCAARRLAPKGWLTLIQRIERLPETLRCLEGRLGSVAVRPLAARMDRAPNLFLLQARKEGRAEFHMSTPLILHAGLRHEKDGDDYTPDLSEILRNGASLRIRC